MRALKFLWALQNTKVHYKLQSSFNLVPGQLSNLRVKVEQKQPLILTKVRKKFPIFFEKSLLLGIIFHIKPLHIARMTPRMYKSTYKTTSLASR